jgi:hypothetical protein
MPGNEAKRRVCWTVSRRGIATAAVCAASALGAAACGGGHTHGTTVKGLGAGLGPQSARLPVATGRSTARFVVTAPSPARYSFDVFLNTPPSADIAVEVRTWYGSTLSIFDSRDHRGHDCPVEGSREICFLRFPLLPAQKAGRWTVVVTKRSGPSAVVSLAVQFRKP